MQQRGCCRGDGDVPLKPSLRPGRVAHSGSHAAPARLFAVLRQEGVMGGWSLTDRTSRDCTCLFCFKFWKTLFEEIMLVMVLLGAAEPFLTHT